jgi:hypothetical protein
MKFAMFILLLSTYSAVAQNNVGGRVTYIASGSVYLSLGRDQGVEDSARVFVIRSLDTIAVLQVFAVSSKSSVCKILDERKTIMLGDSIRAHISNPSTDVQLVTQKFDSTAEMQIDTSSGKPLFKKTETAKKQLNIRGRIGFQYYAMLFDDASLNVQQPGLVVSMRGDLADVPIKFDIYGTMRMIGRNNSAPFSSQATNDSRLYRFSLEYDNQSMIIGVGRILPVYASSVGYMDGLSIARRLGNFVSGIAFGFQPNASLQMPMTDMKKFLAFTQYQSNDTWNTTASASYARIWSPIGIEREALSTYVSMFSPNGFSLYASSDIDLRSLSNGENRFSPALSLFVCSANYRFSDIITAGIAIDASRPVYSLSSNRTIPDSLLDNELHSGISFNANITVWRGAWIYDSYTIRPAGIGFSREYSNLSTFYYNNVAMTGANFRVNYLVNESTITTMHGYGFNVQRNMFGVDIGVRYQQNHSDILQVSMENTTTTLGADCSVFLTNQLTLMGSFDMVRGLGSTSRSIFIELSRRF